MPEIPSPEGNGRRDAAIEQGAGGLRGLFRARLDQIIDMRHERVRVADEIDWDWADEGCWQGATTSARVTKVDTDAYVILE